MWSPPSPWTHGNAQVNPIVEFGRQEPTFCPIGGTGRRRLGQQIVWTASRNSAGLATAGTVTAARYLRWRQDRRDTPQDGRQVAVVGHFNINGQRTALAGSYSQPRELLSERLIQQEAKPAMDGEVSKVRGACEHSRRGRSAARRRGSCCNARKSTRSSGLLVLIAASALTGTRKSSASPRPHH
jgi:hypothetical protein